MKDNWPECYRFVRQFEGGNDDDPADHGGRTSRGITQSEWNRFRASHPGRPSDVWKASEEDIQSIYHDGIYWNGQQLDYFFSGGDETIFDYGVNSGPGRSQKVLRRCLHLPDNAPRLDVDAAIERLSLDQKKVLIKSINAERAAFLRHLNQPRFTSGWLKRVWQVNAISLHLADVPIGAPQVVPAVVIPEASADETSEMSAKAKHSDPTGTKQGVVGGAGTGTVAAGYGFWGWITAHPVETGIIVVIILIAVAAAFELIRRYHITRQEAPPPGWAPPPELKPVTI